MLNERRRSRAIQSDGEASRAESSREHRLLFGQYWQLEPIEKRDCFHDRYGKDIATGDENRATWPAGTPGRTRGELGLALPAPALVNVSYLYCVCYSPLCMTTIRDRVGEAVREIA
ncbi:hypothetical protein ACFW04_000620 [Cataglyphis niger]